MCILEVCKRIMSMLSQSFKGYIKDIDLVAMDCIYLVVARIAWMVRRLTWGRYYRWRLGSSGSRGAKGALRI